MEGKNVLSVHLVFLVFLFSLLLVTFSYIPLDQDEGHALDALMKSWQGVSLFIYEYAFGIDFDLYYNYFCHENSGGQYIKFDCSSESWHIVYLDLSGASLNGSIPPEIGNFTMLMHLNLSRNNLNGAIPEEIGKLTSLMSLDLSFNKLSGQIPPSFQTLASLRFLYLGNNNLTGPFSFDTASSSLEALDLSFNPINGSLESPNSTLSINILGTFVELINTTDREKRGIYNCLPGWSCSSTDLSYITQFAINCGGTTIKSSSIIYYGDKEVKGEAFFYIDPERRWAVSNIGSGSMGRTVKTNHQIYAHLDEELYKTAVMSPKSLRYIVFGLKNGNYSVALHFAEIDMDITWPRMRFFDVYIQGERRLTDFNILNETKYFTALVKSFYAQVNTSFIDIHFLQAARWNCCGPRDLVLGPLVSAISLTRVEASSEAPVYRGDPNLPGNQAPPSAAPSGVDSNREALRRRGRISGIILLCTAIIFVASSVVYMWWIKDSTTGHIRICTESPRS